MKWLFVLNLLSFSAWQILIQFTNISLKTKKIYLVTFTLHYATWNRLSISRNWVNLLYITLSGNSEAVAAGCKKDQTPARPIWSFSSQLLSTGLKAIQWVRSFFFPFTPSFVYSWFTGVLFLFHTYPESFSLFWTQEYNLKQNWHFFSLLC